MKRMPLVPAAIFLLTAVALLGPRFVGGSDSPQIGRRVEIGDTAFVRLEGQSTLAELMGRYDVVVGRVVDSENVSDGTIPHKGMPAAVSEADRDLPRYDPEKSPPFTSGYDVELTDVIDSKTGLIAGQSIRVVQPGGLWKGTAYEFRGDPVIEIGKTYLFFLVKGSPPNDTYGALMWGRFELGDGRLEPVSDEWDSIEAVRELRGLSIPEATAKIAEAKASAATR